MSTFLQPLSPVMGASETVSSVTATNTVVPGTYWADSSGNQYVYVYATGTVNQGQYAVIAGGASGMTCTPTHTTNIAAIVGVARNATIATGSYGWLCYRGFTGISTDGVSFTTGQALIAGTNGNFQAQTTALGSFATLPALGNALVTVNAQTTCSTAGNANACWVNVM